MEAADAVDLPSTAVITLAPVANTFSALMGMRILTKMASIVLRLSFTGRLWDREISGEFRSGVHGGE
jgi:hypothetical protein